MGAELLPALTLFPALLREACSSGNPDSPFKNLQGSSRLGHLDMVSSKQHVFFKETMSFSFKIPTSHWPASSESELRSLFPGLVVSLASLTASSLLYKVMLGPRRRQDCDADSVGYDMEKDSDVEGSGKHEFPCVTFPVRDDGLKFLTDTPNSYFLPPKRQSDIDSNAILPWKDSSWFKNVYPSPTLDPVVYPHHFLIAKEISGHRDLPVPFLALMPGIFPLNMIQPPEAA